MDIAQAIYFMPEQDPTHPALDLVHPCDLSTSLL